MSNPVLRKELFMRMRMRKLPIATRAGMVLGAAVLLGAIYYFVIHVWIVSALDGGSGYSAWSVLVGIQMAIICLVAPVVTANSITQEKEQQTWEMLLYTRLTPSEILSGKLVARTAMLSALMLLFVPMELVGWVKSPHLVSGTMMLLTYATLVASMVFYATFGLYMSWLLNRTIFAIMGAYSFVIGGLIVGTTAVTWVLSQVLSEDLFSRCPLMWLNPAIMIWEAMNPRDSANTILFLIYGLTVYAILSMLMLWRMSIGFRRFIHSP